jgi:hypothetical protein
MHALFSIPSLNKLIMLIISLCNSSRKSERNKNRKEQRTIISTPFIIGIEKQLNLR